LAEAELFKKRQMIAEARRRLVELEEEGLKTEEWLQHLQETSNRMLRREMQALGVLSSHKPDESLALGDQSLFDAPAPEPSHVDLADLFFSDDPQWILDSGGSVSWYVFNPCMFPCRFLTVLQQIIMSIFFDQMFLFMIPCEGS
jgi:hypothetical protein